MVKCFCDKCKKEVPSVVRVPEWQVVTDGIGIELLRFIKDEHDLCETCNERFERLNLDVADYMNMSEEELDFLDCTFSVGDEVITSTGKVGVITKICTCDDCQQRGFYEPTVEIKVGNGAIYLTDNDKRVGFRSFYKIGNRVFGNIDEDVVLADIRYKQKQRKQLDDELVELNKQLNIVRYYNDKIDGGDR